MATNSPKKRPKADGFLVGPKHTDGGIKVFNKGTGQQLEVEGGEVVITAPAVEDDTKREFEGEMLTNREILSKINVSGGGRSFAEGGEIPEKIKWKGKYKVGDKMLSGPEVVEYCGCGCMHEKVDNLKSDAKAELMARGGTLEGRARDYRLLNAYTELNGQGYKEGGELPSNSDLSEIQPRITQHYSNAYELNKAIESLVNSKSADHQYTAEEKEFISHYSGYGGLEKFGATGKGLLYEYFTPSLIAQKMWGLAYKWGFKDDGKVLEPSAGIGEFIKYAPDQNKVTAYEINAFSATIIKILYPGVKVFHNYFEEIFLFNRNSIKGKTQNLAKYDLVIGNPPYGEFGGIYAGMGEKQYTRAGNYIDYFIFRGLDLLNPGGLLIYIVGAEVASGGKPFLQQSINPCKEEIMSKSELLDAYRLPNGVFERTDVLTDIIVLKKK